MTTKQFVSDVSFESDVTIGDTLTLQGVSISASGTSLYVGGVELAGDGMSSSSNLSDVADISAARINLGLEIGVDVQAYNSVLQDISISGGFVGGDVTGTGSELTVQPSLITGQTVVNADLSDKVLVVDASDGRLKTVYVSSIASASGGATEFAQLEDIVGSGLDNIAWGDLSTYYSEFSSGVYEGLVIQDSKSSIGLGATTDTIPKLATIGSANFTGLIFSDGSIANSSTMQYSAVSDTLVFNGNFVIGSQSSPSKLGFHANSTYVNQITDSLDEAYNNDTTLATVGAIMDYLSDNVGDVTKASGNSKQLVIWGANNEVEGYTGFAVNTDTKTLTISPNPDTAGLTVKASPSVFAQVKPEGFFVQGGTGNYSASLTLDTASGFLLDGYLKIGESVAVSAITDDEDEEGTTTVLTANATKTWAGANKRKIIDQDGGSVANGSTIDLDYSADYSATSYITPTIMMVTVYVGSGITGTTLTFMIDLVNSMFMDSTSGSEITIGTSTTQFASNNFQILNDIGNEKYVLTNSSAASIIVTYQVI